MRVYLFWVDIRSRRFNHFRLLSSVVFNGYFGWCPVTCCRFWFPSTVPLNSYRSRYLFGFFLWVFSIAAAVSVQWTGRTNECDFNLIGGFVHCVMETPLVKKKRNSKKTGDDHDTKEIRMSWVASFGTNYCALSSKPSWQVVESVKTKNKERVTFLEKRRNRRQIRIGTRSP